MRIGFNPHRDQPQEQSEYIHQIVIPVYIPNQEGYFKDSFKILQLCLESLFSTIHDKTFITIVNNGSGEFIKEYLNELLKENKIHELIQTQNIGKLNAILKGLAGNNIPLITITDADVLFLPDWQSETVKVFCEIPKAGVVGIVPQIKMYTSNCGNAIFDNLFKKRLKFIPVKNEEAFIRFYESIGRGYDCNQSNLKLGLGLEYEKLKCFLGSGHFVATYKRDLFEEIVTYLGYKLGGTSEGYLDKAPLKKDYWRLTTHDNYAYHMGNVYEDWMSSIAIQRDSVINNYSNFNFVKRKKVNAFTYFIKNRLVKKIISIKWIMRLFFKWKKLPKEIIKEF